MLALYTDTHSLTHARTHIHTGENHAFSTHTQPQYRRSQTQTRREKNKANACQKSTKIHTFSNTLITLRAYSSASFPSRLNSEPIHTCAVLGSELFSINMNALSGHRSSESKFSSSSQSGACVCVYVCSYVCMYVPVLRLCVCARMNHA
jgi:hypothetical protein